MFLRVNDLPLNINFNLFKYNLSAHKSSEI